MKNDKDAKREETEIYSSKKSVAARINELVGRIKELEDQVKRALADYQNLEKRVQEERTEWIRTSNKELLLRILPVFDTLIMAGKHSGNETLQVSIKQFEDVLQGEGIERIETVGKTFDPETMECVATETGQEDRVLEEVRAGYKLHDKVLRVAQVKVGRKI